MKFIKYYNGGIIIMGKSFVNYVVKIYRFGEEIKTKAVFRSIEDDVKKLDPNVPPGPCFNFLAELSKYVADEAVKCEFVSFSLSKISADVNFGWDGKTHIYSFDHNCNITSDFMINSWRYDEILKYMPFPRLAITRLFIESLTGISNYVDLVKMIAEIEINFSKVNPFNFDPLYDCNCVGNFDIYGLDIRGLNTAPLKINKTISFYPIAAGNDPRCTFMYPNAANAPLIINYSNTLVINMVSKIMFLFKTFDRTANAPIEIVIHKFQYRSPISLKIDPIKISRLIFINSYFGFSDDGALLNTNSEKVVIPFRLESDSQKNIDVSNFTSCRLSECLWTQLFKIPISHLQPVQAYIPTFADLKSVMSIPHMFSGMGGQGFNPFGGGGFNSGPFGGIDRRFETLQNHCDLRINGRNTFNNSVPYNRPDMSKFSEYIAKEKDECYRRLKELDDIQNLMR
jgi:hypothetical protein